METKKLATFLGWFSIGLGLTELLAPGALTRMLGVGDRNKLVRGFGLREIGAGVGLLTMSNRAPWLWARVAGDALDLGALVAALKNGKKIAVGAAIASVAAVTALDIYAGAKA